MGIEYIYIFIGLTHIIDAEREFMFVGFWGFTVQSNPLVISTNIAIYYRISFP